VLKTKLTSYQLGYSDYSGGGWNNIFDKEKNPEDYQAYNDGWKRAYEEEVEALGNIYEKYST
jgi:hypothetical protein